MDSRVCWCIWIVVSLTIQQASCVTNEQIAALQEFYIATSGSTSWDSSPQTWEFSGTPNPCSGTWRGITCSGASVTKLVLPSYGYDMQGTLPGSLGSLVDLTDFNLQGGRLSGTLPAELGGWTNIQYIDLGFNQLSGTLPIEWASMTSLSELDLNNNQLSGTLPREWASMTSLFYLLLNNNQLSGTLPIEWASMTSLFYFYLSYNDLSGPIPREWASMTSLFYLWLNNNQLSGTLPSELASLASLTSLILDNNQIAGSFPASYSGAWPNLKTFSAANNLLCGNLPNVPPGSSGAIIALDGNLWTCQLPSWCSSGGSTCGTCFPVAQGVCNGIGAGGDPHIIDTHGNSFEIPKAFGNKILALYHDEHLHVNMFVNRTWMFITHLGASFVKGSGIQRHHLEAKVEHDYPVFYLDGRQISDLSDDLPTWIRVTQPHHREDLGVLGEMGRYHVLEVEVDGMFMIVGGYYKDSWRKIGFFNIQVTRAGVKFDVENHGLLQTERNPHLNDLDHYVRTHIFE